MAVMAIMGVMLAMTVFYMPDNREYDNLRRESGRFAATLRLAGENALFQGREWGVMVTTKDYGFVTFSEDSHQWVAEKQEPFAKYTLPDDMRFVLKENIAPALPKIKYPADASPSILLLSSGQTNPFAIDMRSSHSTLHVTLSGDGHSDIMVSEPENDEP